MKNYIAGSIVATGLIIFVFGFEMNAQTPDTLVADVPFDFYVRNEKLPAGRYEFERSTRLTFPAPLIVRSAEGRSRRSILVPTLTGSRTDIRGEGLRITFRRYGSVSFLSGIALAADGLAMTIARTSVEKELARQGMVDSQVTIRTAVSRK